MESGTFCIQGLSYGPYPWEEIAPAALLLLEVGNGSNGCDPSQDLWASFSKGNHELGLQDHMKVEACLSVDGKAFNKDKGFM